jgi:predicted ribosome-associated RNA-binding protein Tma20
MASVLLCFTLRKVETMNDVQEPVLIDLGAVTQVTKGAGLGPMIDANPVLSWRPED